MGASQQQVTRADFSLTVGELLQWALRRRQRFSVLGRSMRPLLEGGEDVLVQPYGEGERPHAGDVVVLQHPKKELHIIKVVHRISQEEVELRGLNPLESSDSRDFGAVESARIIGRLTVILG